MASIAQLVSEIAHAHRQVNNKAFRENIKLLIIQTRNEIIRRSYENHGYVDRILVQRFNVTLTDVNDGELKFEDDELKWIDESDIDITKIKRTTQKVPRPVRLTNNLPFDRVSTIGFKTNKEIPFIKETTARFRSNLPGMCGMTCYDYINGYIYLFPANDKKIPYNNIVIESAFEHPNVIMIENGEVDRFDVVMDENEYLLSEDMIGQLKEIIYKRDLTTVPRETNETPQIIQYN